MMTDPFVLGIGRLLELARQGPRPHVREALWWQCHRGLSADYLKAPGHKVFHILAAGKIEEHPFTPARALSAESLL